MCARWLVPRFATLFATWRLFTLEEITLEVVAWPCQNQSKHRSTRRDSSIRLLDIRAVLSTRSTLIETRLIDCSASVLDTSRLVYSMF